MHKKKIVTKRSNHEKTSLSNVSNSLSRKKRKKRTDDDCISSETSSSQEMEDFNLDEKDDLDYNNNLINEKEILLDENLEKQIPIETLKKFNEIEYFNSKNNSDSKENVQTVENDGIESLTNSNEHLLDDYLKSMTNEFQDNVEELRKVPDFTGKSILILAKTLTSGINIFDSKTLDAILD